MLEDSLNFILIFIAMELYEVSWQKDTTVIGMLSKMYTYYKKSIFLFIFMHPTLFFSAFLMVLTNYNDYATFIFVAKFLDISSKLMMIKQVFLDKDISKEFSAMLFSPVHPITSYFGVLFYPIFIYFIFNPI